MKKRSLIPLKCPWIFSMGCVGLLALPTGCHPWASTLSMQDLSSPLTSPTAPPAGSPQSSAYLIALDSDNDGAGSDSAHLYSFRLNRQDSTVLLADTASDVMSGGYALAADPAAGLVFVGGTVSGAAMIQAYRLAPDGKLALVSSKSLTGVNLSVASIKANPVTKTVYLVSADPTGTPPFSGALIQSYTYSGRGELTALEQVDHASLPYLNFPHDLCFSRDGALAFSPQAYYPSAGRCTGFASYENCGLYSFTISSTGRLGQPTYSSSGLDAQLPLPRLCVSDDSTNTLFVVNHGAESGAPSLVGAGVTALAYTSAGLLSLRGTAPVVAPHPSLGNGSGLAFDSTKRMLFTTDRAGGASGRGSVNAFRIDGSGQVTFISELETLQSKPVTVASHPTRDTLFVGHQPNSDGAGAIEQVSIDPSTGELSHAANVMLPYATDRAKFLVTVQLR